MAHVDSEKRQWDDDDRLYSSSSHSDDSPILSHRSEKRRYYAYPSPVSFSQRHRERRSALSAVSKFCLFCSAMILFCVLMYIPVYNKVNYRSTRKGFVSGWTANTNRDTKIYVQPNNVTTVYEPKNICNNNDKSKKLFLLIIVCSSINNFDRRQAIRETWANYDNYKTNLVIFNKVTEKYKNYNFSYDLYSQRNATNTLEVQLNNATDNVTYTVNNVHVNRSKRDISSYNKLLPVLAKVLSNYSLASKTEIVPESVDEKRFEDDDDLTIPGFDMNEVIKEQNDVIDFDYNNDDSNIMRIPPKDEYAEENPDLNKILNILKQSKDFDKIKRNFVEDEGPVFRLVFLLGMPSKKNSTEQKRIEDEIETYDDIIQEDFIDSYNNLTLKSIMMLKWVTKNCNNSVRYILKTDDDTYVNLPNLILSLKNRSRAFDSAANEQSKEYMLIGDMISGAKPVHDFDSKWFSPRYMYNGRVYPRYLSGSGYCMSMHTAVALYAAALSTHYFHLEDIYITGMCALRASPRITARDDPLFAYPAASDACWAHAHYTAHRVTPAHMRAFHTHLRSEDHVDRCEKIRLTKIRQKMLQQKLRKSRKSAIGRMTRAPS